jgi:aldose 1-epimerase
MTLAPTGQQFAISSGRHSAVAVELGASLRTYEIDGSPVLDGYAADAPVTSSRGMPLLPWPNRIEDGRYTFDGEEHQLPINRVEENTAIHGLTRWVPWQALEHTASRVVLGTTMFPQPGYPFTLALSVTYELSDAGLTVETTARNAGKRALPFGAGHHPYLATPGSRVDAAVLTVPARRYIAFGKRTLPAGEHDVEASPFDFRSPRQIGPLTLAVCYFDLARDADGRVRVRVSGTTLWADATYAYMRVFSGDDLVDPAERRRGLAVEPMTCRPNAFRTGVGLIVLQPGQSVTCRWGIEPAS